ncbi:MAG: hypothetical protein AABY13_03515 [Nanoarchaeota archaeon]
MKTHIYVILMILALVAACAPAQQAPVAPQPSAPQQDAQPAPQAVPAPIPVVDEEPVVPTLDDATNTKLSTNFRSGSKIGISEQVIKLRVGESRLIGIGIRALQQDTSVYQLNFSLKNSYDKSRNLIVSGTNKVDNWVAANVERKGNYGFPAFELANNGEKRVPFLLEIKPTFADGSATKPGTYEFEFKVFTDYDALSAYRDYATIKLTVLVE